MTPSTRGKQLKMNQMYLHSKGEIASFLPMTDLRNLLIDNDFNI